MGRDLSAFWYWTSRVFCKLLGSLEINCQPSKFTCVNTLTEKVDMYNVRIEEFSYMPRYEEPVKKLCCLNGIATHTAMCALVEVGDFHRFEKASNFAAHLGFVPGEDSSSDRQQRTGITKAGKTV